MFDRTNCKGRKRLVKDVPMRPRVIEYLYAPRDIFPQFKLLKHRSFGRHYFELRRYRGGHHLSFHATQKEAHKWARENMG